MARNYTLPTIKQLFAEASECAYPGCAEALVFHDRGKATVTAEIAHIRSEKAKGPRHDPAYSGDLNGPANLLLLCGRHHKPVDRHEVAYSIADLETWKAAQVAAAGGGIPLSEADLRSFVRLSDDERRLLIDIARLAQRVINACVNAQSAIEAIAVQAEKEHHSRFAMRYPIYEVDDEGNRVGKLGPEDFQMSYADRCEVQRKQQESWDAVRPQVEAAINTLSEELAVLRMMGGSLSEPALHVVAAAMTVRNQVGQDEAMTGSIRDLNANVQLLWQIAHGEAE